MAGFLVCDVSEIVIIDIFFIFGEVDYRRHK